LRVHATPMGFDPLHMVDRHLDALREASKNVVAPEPRRQSTRAALFLSRRGHGCHGMVGVLGGGAGLEDSQAPCSAVEVSQPRPRG